MYYIIKISFILLISSLSAVVFSSVLHISVYEADSKVEVNKNGVLKIRLNFVSSDINDYRKTQVFFVQGKHTRQMNLKKLNDYMLLASIDNIELNQQAKLLVKYFDNKNWTVVKNLDVNPVIEHESYFASKPLTTNPNAGSEIASNRTPFHSNVESSADKNVTQAKDVARAEGKVNQTAAIVLNRNLPSNQSSELASSNLEKSNCVINYNGETLWSLGVKYSTEWDRDIYSTILAIYYSNDHAFNRSDINSIRLDAKLNCPSLAMLSRFGTKEQAKEKYRSIASEHK